MSDDGDGSAGGYGDSGGSDDDSNADPTSGYSPGYSGSFSAGQYGGSPGTSGGYGASSNDVGLGDIAGPLGGLFGDLSDALGGLFSGISGTLGSLFGGLTAPSGQSPFGGISFGQPQAAPNAAPAAAPAPTAPTAPTAPVAPSPVAPSLSPIAAPRAAPAPAAGTAPTAPSQAAPSQSLGVQSQALGAAGMTTAADMAAFGGMSGQMDPSVTASEVASIGPNNYTGPQAQTPTAAFSANPPASFGPAQGPATMGVPGVAPASQVGTAFSATPSQQGPAQAMPGSYAAPAATMTAADGTTYGPGAPAGGYGAVAGPDTSARTGTPGPSPDAGTMGGQMDGFGQFSPGDVSQRTGPMGPTSQDDPSTGVAMGSIMGIRSAVGGPDAMGAPSNPYGAIGPGPQAPGVSNTASLGDNAAAVGAQVGSTNTAQMGTFGAQPGQMSADSEYGQAAQTYGIAASPQTASGVAGMMSDPAAGPIGQSTADTDPAHAMAPAPAVPGADPNAPLGSEANPIGLDTVSIDPATQSLTIKTGPAAGDFSPTDAQPGQIDPGAQQQSVEAPAQSLPANLPANLASQMPAGFGFTGYMAGMHSIEGGVRSDGSYVNNASNHYGPGQFSQPTWSTVRANNPELGLPASMYSATHEQYSAAENALTAMNVIGLQRAGIAVTNASVYAAHQMGLAGAVSFFGHPDDTALSSFSARDQAMFRANPAIYGGQQTVGDVKANIASKFGQTAQASPAPGGIASVAGTDNAASQTAGMMTPAMAAVMGNPVARGYQDTATDAQMNAAVGAAPTSAAAADAMAGSAAATEAAVSAAFGSSPSGQPYIPPTGPGSSSDIFGDLAPSGGSSDIFAGLADALPATSVPSTGSAQQYGITPTSGPAETFGSSVGDTAPEQPPAQAPQQPGATPASGAQTPATDASTTGGAAPLTIRPDATPQVPIEDPSTGKPIDQSSSNIFAGLGADDGGDRIREGFTEGYGAHDPDHSGEAPWAKEFKKNHPWISGALDWTPRFMTGDPIGGVSGALAGAAGDVGDKVGGRGLGDSAEKQAKEMLEFLQTDTAYHSATHAPHERPVEAPLSDTEKAAAGERPLTINAPAEGAKVEPQYSRPRADTDSSPAAADAPDRPTAQPQYDDIFAGLGEKEQVLSPERKALPPPNERPQRVWGMLRDAEQGVTEAEAAGDGDRAGKLRMTMQKVWNALDDNDKEAVKGQRIKEAEETAREIAHEPAGEEPSIKSAGAAATPTEDLLRDNIAKRDAARAEAEKNEPGITQKIMDVGRAAAKTFDAIINPARFDEHAARAAGDIRSGLGSMNRESAIYQRYMKGFAEEGKEIGKDPGAVTDFYDWVQNRTRNENMGRLTSPEAQPMFDAIRKTVRGVEDRLKALDKHADLNFLQDYFPQMWEREGYARTVFTKERKYATFADGIRAGLTPKYMDPIEAMTHYVEQMNKYIATQEAIEAAKGRGDIRYFASKPPEGWAKIDRLSRGEMSAYAPEGFARVWNRHLSVQKQGRIGDAIRAFQRISNANTGFHLGLSGFHAFNIAGETLVNGLAEAVGAAAHGNLPGAGKAFASAPLKWATNIRKGVEMAQVYLGETDGSPEMRKIVDLATDANMRVFGKGRAADEYRFAKRSILDGWKNGTRAAEAKLGVNRLAKGNPIPLVGQAARGLSEAMEAISNPLFEHYIPMAKNGAFYDTMSRWLQENPEATHEEQTAAARSISDTMDNRFGEMVHENLFWDKNCRVAAQMAFLSYSYTFGTLRMAGAAGRDFSKLGLELGKKAFGKDGKPVWTNDMSYAIALPMGAAMLGTATQFLLTGKPPGADGEPVWKDLFFPRTGGTNKDNSPERVVIPSYINSMFGYARHPVDELWNKKNPIIEQIGRTLTGTNWKTDRQGDHLSAIPKGADTEEAIKAYLMNAWDQFTTISLGGEKVSPTSNIPGAARAITGVRPAGAWVTKEPKGYGGTQ